MYKSWRVAVVVPAFNEERFIGGVLSTMPAFVDRIVVVDDGSDDATARVAASAGDPRVTVLRAERNRGVGAAMRLGYRAALEDGAELIAKMDGDGQMPPEYLSRLLDALTDEAYDYAKGNRFLLVDSLETMPRVRLVGNMGLTFMTKLASGFWHVFDPQNGFTAIRAQCLRRLDLEAIYDGYFFENDMLIQLSLRDFRVRDVPVPARYGDEESGLSPLGVSLRFPYLLTRRFFGRIVLKYVLRDFSPIALFLFVGLALFGWGTVFGAYIWIKSNVTGHATPIGTIMLALLPLILGFQLLLQAIVLDIHESKK
jgi:glycosyltransferase involved in cell wall biosynthesis